MMRSPAVFFAASVEPFKFQLIEFSEICVIRVQRRFHLQFCGHMKNKTIVKRKWFLHLSKDCSYLYIQLFLDFVLVNLSHASANHSKQLKLISVIGMV